MKKITIFRNKQNKKFLFLGLFLGLILIGIVIYRYQIIPYFKKVSLTTFLQIPTRLTIYEQNKFNDFPKTKIDLPLETGYLIAVYKDLHKLQVFFNNQLIKEYDVNIRRELQDRKKWEDNQTPEGIFYIETMDKIVDPPWSRWMRLNTVEKANEIYKSNYLDGEKRILEFEKKYGKLNTDEQLRRFNSFNFDQKILRGVGIHGGGFSLYHDWTEGCIALADDDVIELFNLLKQSSNEGIGVKVVIQD